jgi:hypothetical protein
MLDEAKPDGRLQVSVDAGIVKLAQLLGYDICWPEPVPAHPRQRLHQIAEISGFVVHRTESTCSAKPVSATSARDMGDHALGI